MAENKWLLVPCCGNYLASVDKEARPAQVALVSPPSITRFVCDVCTSLFEKTPTLHWVPSELACFFVLWVCVDTRPHHVCDRLPGLGLCGFTDRVCRRHCSHLYGPVEHPGLIQQPSDGCIQLPRPMAFLCPRELWLHGVPRLLHPAGVAR